MINNLNTLKKEANNWQPNLQILNDINSVSDYINKPHEDYPLLVNSTKNAIELGIEMFSDENFKLFERDIKSLHKLIMNDKPYFNGGVYRHISVYINKSDGSVFEPPQFYLIPQFMMSIYPLEISNMSHDDIINWYKVFETIHPFEDGNGRIGGVIMAVLSKINLGYYITPNMI